MRLGDVVYSKSGRDSGRYFAVVATEGEKFVRIADGDVRRLKNAKLKNVRHLKETGDRLERIAEKLEAGAQVFDTELYSALKLYDKNRK